MNKFKIQYKGKWRYFIAFKGAVNFARNHPIKEHINEDDELPMVYEKVRGKWKGFIPNRFYIESLNYPK